MPRIYRTNTLDDYEITRDGIVINKHTGRILKLQPNGKGYLRFSIRENGKLKFLFVHRLVAKMYVPNPYNKPQVNHIDGDKKNNRADNLEWVTNYENRRHAVTNGLHLSGEKCPWSKLTKEDANYIRAHPNVPRVEMAKKFNISRGAVYSIVHGRIWKD